ncbi:hypothetical protein HCJ52_01175 [Listeria sp. FSL L7-1485]|uniref:Uncharacterized protein n=1 Tax=Listeria immobilis TaxID=2713502 RepID=A0A7X1C7R4_9LIST|nr:hypothetical protein [Listeria immobilis]MBC1481827.1 hypothetical protein [Listeria immobilis]MBC1487503.1 hypothetical protein [Listeria immobilis]MBC1506812.1 hypothetical protein [Listeria immobilis]MBC1509669.1 hypothetical protein [Listeria immobilis]MBC1515414.1 hypothetical protein [Listeria immobilis]
MRKSYFSEYGTKLSKEQIKNIFEDKWDIICSEHDSLFFGVYFLYKGLYADKLTITDNYVASSQEWLYAENKQFNTLVEVAFTNGRNADKLSRYKFMKNVINQMDEVVLIEENCIEETS